MKLQYVDGVWRVYIPDRKPRKAKGYAHRGDHMGVKIPYMLVLLLLLLISTSPNLNDRYGSKRFLLPIQSPRSDALQL